jgi:predicted RND superfamily exporter protein
VSGLTTIAGFASLTLAKHQGIASLGMVMSFGVAACMIAALAFLPAALHFLQKAGWRLNKPSQDSGH